MTQLTRQEKIDLVDQLIEHKRKIDDFVDKFQKMFGTFPGNGECSYEEFSMLFHDYILLVSKQIGETKDGIEWFVWENDCGAKGLEAGKVGGEMEPIRTADDYVNFIEFSNKD